MTALDSLAGLSVGDAFGAQFFAAENRRLLLDETAVPPAPWPWTDDTEMACNLVDVLQRHGEVDRDALAAAFADRYDPYRGYGPGTVVLLRALRDGASWRTVSPAQFGGHGSMGNGAAMRAAPLGAYYPGDLERVALEAAASAVVTHAHPEGIAGAVAVAIAASYVARGDADGLMDAVLAHTPPGAVHDGVRRAAGLLDRTREEAAYELGNGSRVLAHDTVPFCLWVAARHLTDYERAVRTCVAVGGDIDTTAAITGGIVAAHTGAGGIPEPWLAAREPLPGWIAESKARR
ncbi:ADP-ribosylglycohydrolase family protein [Actinoallomurus purpureus]|uniref:ADP-ribosylglycohydrolase family protein n=1 Tax=Actinoallomurus purpureus TaxID=478114 RepID=UPI0020938E10|nr:ADP-ribosylglycohydrolase family protein [Actinoallomurus purpureus]MCO6009970.1 ADP-ribosylglycohydrolase family protein [Actinoallomurus purpureus]